MAAVRARLDPKTSRSTRRTASRRKLRLDAHGSTAADSANVTILNISTTGLLIETTGDLRLGETIELDLAEAPGVRVVVKWSSGQLFGCQFREPLSVAAVSGALLRAPSGPPDSEAVIPPDTADLAGNVGQRGAAHPPDERLEQVYMLNALRPILETALDAVVVMQSDGTIAAWNLTAERTFGWGEAEAIGRPMSDLIVPPKHRKAHRIGLERYLTTGEERLLNRRIDITAIDKVGREFPIELSITATSSGSKQLFVGYLRDISVRRRDEMRLARQTREARLLFEVTNLSAETASFDEALRVTLQAICTVTGWPVGHAFLLRRRDKLELVSTGVWHETIAGDALDLRRATEELQFRVGFGLPGKVLELGAPKWISDTARDPNFARKGFGFRSAFAFPVTSEGKTVAVLEFFGRDTSEPDAELMLTVRTLGEQVGRVLERKRTEEHQRLLLRELNHRVKNMLAVVQGVACQTFKGDAASPAARRAFDNRLSALAAAHDVLTAERWESASIRDIISRTGLGCGVVGQRWRAAGPDIQLRPRAAVALAMALHELCTNAVKYGALSGNSGGVEISWRVSGGHTLHLVWTEAGGPRVRQPEARGFGSKMIERALASELGGSVELRFGEDGVQCVIEAPLTD